MSCVVNHVVQNARVVEVEGQFVGKRQIDCYAGFGQPGHQDVRSIASVHERDYRDNEVEELGPVSAREHVVPDEVEESDRLIRSPPKFQQLGPYAASLPQGDKQAPSPLRVQEDVNLPQALEHIKPLKPVQVFDHDDVTSGRVEKVENVVHVPVEGRALLVE